MSIPLDAIYQQLSPVLTARRWLVAYSGGVDSHTLLHILVNSPRHPPIEAVHINHQLQDCSDQWAEHCQRQADALAVPLHSVRVAIDSNSGASPEQRARRARYAAFENLIDSGDVLLLGHHLDDQVETLLLRLLRGSGTRGAAAMPQRRAIGRGQLLRPLLEVPRSAIEHYAADHQLQWISDPSNNSSDIDRNFLRWQILPTLAQRWPQYRQTLSRAAALNEESANLNTELAELDFHALSLSPEQPSLPVPAVSELSAARQKNLLRYWLQVRHLPMPSAAQLQLVLDQVVNARRDAEPLVEWPGVQIRRFKQQLYAMAPLPVFDHNAVYHWDLSQPLTLPGAGTLAARSATGAGIDTSRLDRKGLTIRFRRGGERCQPAGRGASQSLKKLFQEYQLETWLRDRVPLIYSSEQLVMVADLWVCEGFQAAAGEPGWLTVWTPP